MKYFKRITNVILCIVLLCGQLILFPVSASVPEGSFAGIGDYTAHLLADPSTANIPTDFGSVSANGKVWVDKSVDVKQDSFEITLSALAQEYISEDESLVGGAPAADVVMLLDLSGSMQDTLTLDGESMSRTKAMVKAVNEAVEIIMSANINNRILIYTYQGSGTSRTPLVREFLPLGHYTNDSWNNEDIWSGNLGKYFNYNTTDAIQSAQNLKKDGTKFSQKSISTGSGTYTQNGLFKSISSLISSIGKESKTVERKPYVLLFTDGAPGCANTSWYDTTTTVCDLNHNNDGTAQITALSVLSAAMMKDRLYSAYETYNGKVVEVEWFNIGLGVSDNINGTLFLTPKDIASNNTDTGKAVRDYINTYTSGRYSSYASYKTNYVYTENSYLVNSGNALKEAFKALGDKVEAETKTITFPVISSNDSMGDLVFTDVMGKGLKVDDITLNPTATTSVKGVVSGNTYTFAGYEMTATLSTNEQGQQVLTWIVPAKEIAIFSFANRQNPTDGNYIPAEPLRLHYKASVADPQNYNGLVIYSNEDAKAQFSIAKDNPYYHDVDGNVKASSFAAQTKLKNTSGTDANYISFTTKVDDNISVTAKLGNNGILKPAMQIQKEADSQFAEPKTDVGYVLTIKNVGDETLNNVVVTDTLPAELSYKVGSAEEIEPVVNGQVLTFTIPKVEKGHTFIIHYKATLSADAVNHKEITNTAAISEIHTIEVYNPVETTSTFTVQHLYKVNYSWTGDVPSSVTLPTDAGRYPTGANYSLDGQFTNHTKIENKDAFGNVIERWTFSGWNDSGAGVMGTSDVTISGVWNYESFTVLAHRVLYTWSGDIPANVILPNDSGTYVYNQPYAVDSTFTSQTVIPTYDAYGNISGRYTFSGWTDSNNGIMGNQDITIPGVWRYESATVEDYIVLYKWSGDIPEGSFPPVDENRYVPNQPYTLDTTFGSQTAINNYDEFGNVCGRWTFSGWTDPNGGTMGQADVTIEGVWTYTSVPVTDYKVTYFFSGDIPEGKIPPVDENRYVPNQPYTLDTTFGSQTAINNYDEFGNVCGRWTFSGWTDPNGGTMGQADVTVEGVWTYTAVPITDYKITYLWSGDIPVGKIPPVDETRYVPNQPYLVDNTFNNLTQIQVTDSVGNLIGRYTFSGWEDENDGVMGTADVIIKGVWSYEEFSQPESTPDSEVTTPTPESPKTGDTLQIGIVIVLWTTSVLTLIVSKILRKKIKS